MLFAHRMRLESLADMRSNVAVPQAPNHKHIVNRSSSSTFCTLYRPPPVSAERAFYLFQLNNAYHDEIITLARVLCWWLFIVGWSILLDVFLAQCTAVHEYRNLQRDECTLSKDSKSLTLCIVPSKASPSNCSPNLKRHSRFFFVARLFIVYVPSSFFDMIFVIDDSCIILRRSQLTPAEYSFCETIKRNAHTPFVARNSSNFSLLYSVYEPRISSGIVAMFK